MCVCVWRGAQARGLVLRGVQGHSVKRLTFKQTLDLLRVRPRHRALHRVMCTWQACAGMHELTGVWWEQGGGVTSHSNAVRPAMLFAQTAGRPLALTFQQREGGGEWCHAGSPVLPTAEARQPEMARHI